MAIRRRGGCRSCGKRNKNVSPSRDTKIQLTANPGVKGEVIPPPGKSPETFGVMEPLVRNWKYKPPAGGWAVNVRVAGVNHHIQGPPKQMVQQILRLHRDANLKMNEQTVWDWLNRKWQARDPKSALKPPSSRGPVHAAEPDGHIYITPDITGILGTFGMKEAFSAEEWESAVNRTTRILDPGRSPATGCEECFEAWSKFRLEFPSEKVYSEHQAADWIWRASNYIRKSQGQREVPFYQAVKDNNWAFRVEGHNTKPE